MAASTVYLGLGSNLDNPAQQLQTALFALDRLPSTSLEAVSSVYVTRPVGPADQPDFLNAVACISTTLAPLPLLRRLQQIELQQGRARTRHWGPRTLDLDILVFDTLQLNEPDLIIPHPRAFERQFVLRPLTDIAPATLLISAELTLSEALSHCPDTGIRPSSINLLLPQLSTSQARVLTGRAGK